MQRKDNHIGKVYFESSVLISECTSKTNGLIKGLRLNKTWYFSKKTEIPQVFATLTHFID